MKKKKGLKIFSVVLLIIIVGLGSFYLYATQAEGRSAQSKAY